MKALLRQILARFGYSLKHLDRDPVISNLDNVREQLRLNPTRNDLRLHALAQLALFAHLRELFILHQPDLLVDVGANRGQFARSARELGYAGVIVSLEPQAALARELRTRAARTDPAWHIIHGGAGDSEAELVLQTYVDDTFSSLHHANQTAHQRFGGLLAPGKSETVIVRPLDAWLAASPYAAASRVVLKTDTQGHDLAVLRGAPQTLAKAVTVLAEASLVPLYDSSATIEDLSGHLAAFGLRLGGAYAVSHDDRDLAALELDCLFTRAPR